MVQTAISNMTAFGKKKKNALMGLHVSKNFLNKGLDLIEEYSIESWALIF